ncbi:hypothetical protein [Noviherbaspirillum sp.]|uniref:hypothetical protein n=1 Tax=Noviherbaspirillum sp. TaxID=1926288 RepID=UPI002B461A20|nr:hypothetical protein [Noviherbaspirillum sp.]HJV81792.1 hypothetical protein [Noviherbaspirillum sp.]
MTAAMASVGWLIACSACAQANLAEVDDGVVPTMPQQVVLRHPVPRLDAKDADDVERRIEIENTRPDSAFQDGDASFHFRAGERHEVFGYADLPGASSLWPPVSSLRSFFGSELSGPGALNYWLDAANNRAAGLTLGYAWRGLKLEGSAASGVRQDDRKPVETEALHLDSRSTRLSFHPSDHWTFQISRGTLVGLDQVVPSGDARRAAISTSYYRPFRDGDWQTTMAWGRTSRKYREATTGYLLESALRFDVAHTVFGRLEQVGSDDLLYENGSPQRVFKMNKLTLGYFKDVQTSGPLKFDVGALVSKHFIPVGAVPTYGAEPVSYMLFVRLKLQ